MSTTTARTTTGTAEVEAKPVEVRTQEQVVTSAAARRVLAISRVVLGSTFLWGFADKLLGLGYPTQTERSWIAGGTPAQGYLGSVEGPFAELFRTTVQNPVGDWLYMLALLGIGVAVVLGAGLRVAAVAGTVFMLTLYLTQLPWVVGGTNPVVDVHWVNALVLWVLAVTLAGDTWGVGRIWARIVGDSWLR